MIKDAGLGLKPEDTTRIFKMFEQVDNGQREGLGIGLALAQHLTELHGGVVTATSQGLGKGSIFKISLPIAMHSVQASTD